MGGYTTALSQTGTVTAISPTSITVRSDDGYSQTYVIAEPAGPPPAIDEQVTVRATRDGQTSTVTAIELRKLGDQPTSKPSGFSAVTGGVTNVVASSVGAASSVVVSPSVTSGPSLKMPVLSGVDANVTPSAPIATAAPAPTPAATSFQLLRFHG